jgi:ubiquinol-cytochrome c reductase cytochrome c1 subunit
MIRLISILGGLFFAAALAWSMIWGVVGFAKEGLPTSVEREFYKHPEHLALPSNGVTGNFDRRQLQRGFQVYQEVCAACHSLKYVAYRDLKQLGYDDDEVKAIAAKAQIPSYNAATGEVKTKAGLPTDRFPPVVYGGQGVPPDLSLITKARHDGAAYVHSLLTGYVEQAGYKNAKGVELLKKYPDAKTPDGLYFNPYFPNLNIAMPAPIAGDGQVTYSDGTKATVDQMSKDVTAFLVWTAEPSLAKRNQTGWAVVLFLMFASVLAYLAYRNVWAGMKH